MNNTKCMGADFTTETHAHALRLFKDWHGKFGHANAETLDHDSYITGMGRHDRALPCIDVETGNLEVTVCDRWKLGAPTKKRMLQIARYDGWNGRWKFASSEQTEFRPGITQTVYTFKK